MRGQVGCSLKGGPVARVTSGSPVLQKMVVTIFVFSAAALLLSLPVSAATTVRLVIGDGSDKQFLLSENKVSLKLTGSGTTVTINATNNSVVEIDRVLIYKCKALLPNDCVLLPPDQFTGNTVAVYEWSQVSSGQQGNFLVLVKLANPTSSWIPFWEIVTKAGEFTSVRASLPQVDLYPNFNGGDRTDSIQDFITKNQMVPFSWLEQLAAIGPLVVQGVGALTIVSSTMAGTPVFSRQTVGTEVEALSAPYAFVFGITNNQVDGVIALNQNPASFTFGDGACNPPDETPANVCYDCACAGGSYCDSSRGCSLESQVTASVVSFPQAALSDCTQPHDITTTLKINSPPTGLSVLRANYSINDNSATTTCTGTPAALSCPLTVPAITGCAPGTYIRTRNNITLTLAYPDAPRPSRTRMVTVPLPDITIGSWSCGDGQAETAIGETSGNCCYDVSCSPAQYCDINPLADRSSGICKTVIGNTSLTIGAPQPAVVSVYSSAGNTVMVSFTIANPPTNMDITSRSVFLYCISNGQDSCSATGTISSCTPAAGASLTENCSISFTIQGYDAAKSYTLTPEIRLRAQYPNGSASIPVYLAKAGPQIGLGTNFCGDGTCSPTESSASCCFDCACASSQFCDATSTLAPSATDVCRETSAISATLLTATPTPPTFVDASAPHNWEINTSIALLPARIAAATPDALVQDIVVACDLNTSFDLGCQVSCKNEVRQSTLHSSCDIVIPAFNYLNSPYYKEADRQVVVPGNDINYTMFYNNGREETSVRLSIPLPPVTIQTTFHRGDGVCETAQGESATNSCIDCPCQEGVGKKYFCFPGSVDSPLGTSPSINSCIKLDQLTAAVSAVEPDRPVCTIGLMNSRDCIMPPVPLAVTVSVANAPEGLSIHDPTYTFYEREEGLTCVPELVPEPSPSPSPSPNPSSAAPKPTTFICPIGLGKLTDGNNWTKVTESGEEYAVAPLTLRLPLQFVSGTGDKAVLVTQEATVSTELRIAFRKSDRVLSCEDNEQKLQDSIEGKDTAKDIITGILIGLNSIVAGLCVACVATFLGAGCSWCCEACVIGGVAAACVDSILLPLLGTFSMQEQQLKAESVGLCADINTGAIQERVSATETIWYQAGGAVMGVVCAVGTWGLLHGEGAASSVKPPTGPGYV